ncbi:MAG: hypothetical protein IIT45_00740, partial [Treponema sp.]|nr:hypothetical protein [Treponema sp.]
MFTIAFYLALVTFFVSKNRKRILGYTSICLTGIGLFCEIFMGFPFVSFLYILNPINWILYGLLPIRGSILVIFQSIIQIVIALIAIKDPEKAKTEKQKNVISDNPNRENSESYFDGGLSQLIGWSILGFLITVITLGICYPWS